MAQVKVNITNNDPVTGKKIKAQLTNMPFGFGGFPKKLTIILTFISSLCFGQKQDTLQLTEIQISKLIVIEKELIELNEKKLLIEQRQKDFIELIFDKPIDKIKIIKYENGKFIYVVL